MSRDYSRTIGASEIAAILGEDRYRTPNDVWRAKVLGERTPLNKHILRGLCLESGLLTWWERLPELDGQPPRRLSRRLSDGDSRDPRQTDVLHPNGWAAATLDGYHKETRQVIEAKASIPSKSWNVKTGEHPFSYHLQVVWQIGVSRAAGLEVDAGRIIMGVAYGDLWEFPVLADDELFAAALVRAGEFLEYVKAGTPLPASFNGDNEVKL